MFTDVFDCLGKPATDFLFISRLIEQDYTVDERDWKDTSFAKQRKLFKLSESVQLITDAIRHATVHWEMSH